MNKLFSKLLLLAALCAPTSSFAAWSFGGYCGRFANNTSVDPWTNFSTTATIPANSVAMLVIGIDNDGDSNLTNEVQTASAVIAAQTEIFNVDGEMEADPSTGGSGAFVAVAWKHFTSTMSLTSGATFTVEFNSAKLTKSAQCLWFNVSAGVTISTAGTIARVADVGDASALQMTGLPLDDYLFMRYVASESTDSSISAVSSGWTAISSVGYNSGTGSSSMGNTAEYIMVASTDSSPVSDPTMSVTGTIDRASSLIAFAGEDVAVSSPVIGSASGVMSGNWTTGNLLTINGSGFGTRSNAKPWIVADFENNRSSPSTLGQKSDGWAVVENATTTTSAAFSGTYSLGSTNLSTVSSTIFRVRADTTTDFCGDNCQSVIFLKRRVTYTYVDLSHKWLRLWDANGTSASGTQYPNFYIATQGATKTSRIYGLEINPDSARTVGISGKYLHPAQTPNNGWRTELYEFKMNSTTNTFDGTVKSYLFIPDGALSGSYFASSTTFSFDSTNAPTAGFEQYSIQDDLSSGVADGESWFDNIYVDISTFSFPAYAFLSDEATLADANASNNNVNMLVPATWSDSQITAYIDVSGFSTGQTVYLYVKNSNGMYNTTGFPITVLQGTVSGSSVELNSGSALKSGTGSIRSGQIQGILAK